MKKTDINKKREKEKQMVSYMIALYCKKNHHNKYNKGSTLPYSSKNIVDN